MKYMTQEEVRAAFPQLSDAKKHSTPIAKFSQGELVIGICLPPKSLSPNSRVHWATKAIDTKLMRGLARQKCFAAMSSSLGPLWKSASVQCTFTFADKRRRDRDNLLASMKAVFDGIADAGVIANDSGLTHEPVVISEPDKSKCGVVVRIRKIS